MKPYWILAPGLASCLCAGALRAQLPGVLSRIPATVMVPMGSAAEEQLRLDQLRGTRSTAGWLLRSSETLTRPLTGPSARIGGSRGCYARAGLVAPSAALTWNSRLPFERNEGGVWSGRGFTAQLGGGLRAECGRLRVVLAPDWWIAQNRAFAILSAPSEGRSSFTSPFYAGREASADLPLRFGSNALLVVQPGQSMAEADAGYVTVGFGSQSQWWGPGIRNGLLMSNHASGIPSAWLRTARPLRSRFGAAEARWMVGALSESPYFDVQTANDLQSIAGLVVTFSPAFDTALTLGAARVVYAPVSGSGAVAGHFLDPLTQWGPGANLRNETRDTADQLTSLFFRWVLPSAGVEAYAEWARVILPASFRSLLQAPQYSQGYTVGTQWISTPDTIAAAWRAQVEFTNLEQPRFDQGEPPAFYVSPAGGHGYTQRGRIIGAGIGPGGSSQWVAVDRQVRSWSAGVMLGRVRWNNEQYYRRSTAVLGWAHDVSLLAGLRGWRNVGPYQVSAELIRESRLNYLFQSAISGYGEDRTFDVRNVSIRFALSPR